MLELQDGLCLLVKYINYWFGCCRMVVRKYGDCCWFGPLQRLAQLLSFQVVSAFPNQV